MAIRNSKLGGIDWVKEHPTVLDLNDTNNTLIDITMIGIAQNAYQTLQANNIFENKDFLVCDEFIDSNGTNNTRTGGTALYESTDDVYYSIASVGTQQDLDSTEYTSGSTSYVTVKTFSAIDSKVYYVKNLCKGSTTAIMYANVIFNYSDLTTSNIEVNFSTSSYIAKTFTNPFFYKEVSSIDIQIKANSPASVHTDENEWYNAVFSNGTVITQSKVLDGTEKSICIYSDKTTPTDTSIIVDITDGVTTLSSQPLNEAIKLTGFTSGTLGITFNLITTDTSITPFLKGYGVYIK